MPKVSLQVLTRSDGFLLLDTEDLAYCEIYSEEIVLGFKGAAEDFNLRKEDVAPEDFNALTTLVRGQFPDISTVVKQAN